MTEETNVSPSSAEGRAAALERRIADMETMTNARLINAELKAEALRAGMIDLDGIKLVDQSSLKLTQFGEVEGLSDVMARLRRNKPWLFGGTSSSSPATAPPSHPPTAKSVKEMTHAEWQAAKAELLKRR